MKLKQIVLGVMLPAMLLGSLFTALLMPATPAEALTNQQKKSCYEKYAGNTGSNANGSKAYRDSNCPQSKGGSCKVTQSGTRDPDNVGTSYVTTCQRSNGDYSNGSAPWKVPVDDSDDSDSSGTGDTSGTPSNPIAGSDCAGVKTAIIKCDATNETDEVNDNGIWALLMMVLNILTAGVGIIAVGGIVYGAILYTTAEDKADQVKNATGIITNVVIGLILYAFMWVGLNFIVPGGVFA